MSNITYLAVYQMGFQQLIYKPHRQLSLLTLKIMNSYQTF